MSVQELELEKRAEQESRKKSINICLLFRVIMGMFHQFMTRNSGGSVIMTLFQQVLSN